MSKNSNRLRVPIKLWKLLSPEGVPLGTVGMRGLIDLATEEGFDAPDFIYESAKMVPFLMERGYTVTYDATGGDETVEIELLD